MGADILNEDITRMAADFPFLEEARGKTFLVTGATGLIGSLTVRLLVAINEEKDLGLKVVAPVRNVEKARRMLPESGILEIVKADLTEPLPDFPQSPDYIIHCASPTASDFLSGKPVETMQTIYLGTSRLLDLARRKRVRGFVFLSSLESYGVSKSDNFITEEFHGYIDPMKSRNSYPVAKLAAECLCNAYAQEYGMRVMVARLTQVMGAGISPSDNRVFAQFARAVTEGRDIVLHTPGHSAKPYCYTTDAVEAIFYILFRGKGGEAYNVANPHTYISIRDLATFVTQNFAPKLGVKTELRDDMGYADPTRLRLDTNRLQNLGWEPRVDLREMFRRLISYIS